MKKLLKTVLVIAGMLIGTSAFANPVICSPGYQDATCVTPIVHAPIPAPTCSSGAGWTTVSPAVWQGSHWSTPQCSFKGQPACPAGQTTTSAATWNGSAWTQPVCTQPAQGNSSPTGVAACDAAAASNGFQIAQQFETYHGNYPYSGGVGVEGIMFGANGPAESDVCGDTTTSYELECILNGDGTLAYLAVVQAFFPSCSGGGN
ncbi:hypothetical protein [Paraburkholderia domus]|uniref:hypothetical protein n=1 Tax=Paraburkholderia domus TaxID=2793075 RepID=UPI0019145A77|nr:hypothetical protein [Paraburkholderia domus]MBK5064809.1 hypothetical protein [Burkholderia sp. R-70199]CAE6956656.1 hypothetical protein R70199_07006 [Paraburkholderia domus]